MNNPARGAARSRRATFIVATAVALALIAAIASLVYLAATLQANLDHRAVPPAAAPFVPPATGRPMTAP